MKKPFLNENRERYYGLRVGDLVTSSWVKNNEEICEVLELSSWDNNRCYLKVEGFETPLRVTAESCKIVQKIEDRLMKEKISESEWNHLHDVVFEATYESSKLSLSQTELESLYYEFPGYLKRDIERWGLNDSVVRDDNDYIGKLICDDNHSCKDIPYALNKGKGFSKID